MLPVPSVAVIVAEVLAVTAVVGILKLAVDAPAGTTTEVGTDALVSDDVSPTVTPPTPATPFNVTVPTDAVPPTTAAGATVNPVSTAGLIVKVPFAELEPREPVIVALTEALTPVVDIVKAAVLDPPGTVTVVGNVAFVLVDVRDTVVPPVGAFPVRVIVPVDVAPAITLVGERVNVEIWAAVTVRLAVCEFVP